MTAIRLIVTIGVSQLLLGCGNDPTAPAAARLDFSAVNGATQPVVFPGETVSCEGIGFGASQGDNQVLVTGMNGLAAAEVVTWSATTITARLPADARSGPVLVLVGGDTLGPVALLVRSDTAFDPATRTWTEGVALPEAVWAAGAAALRYPDANALRSLVVLTAGVAADSSLTSDTYLGAVDGSGAITGWTAAPDTLVPQPRFHHAMAGADQTNSRLSADTLGGLDSAAVVYLLGGIGSGGEVLSEVFGIAVTANAEYSGWSALTPLPRGRAGAAALVAFGNLIVVGGFGSDSLASTSVSIATIRKERSINGWFEGPSLPEGRAFGALVLHRDWLYYIGGEAGLVLPDTVDPAAPELRATVYAIRLSQRTGFFADGAWTELPVFLQRSRSRHAAFVLGGTLVVTGGVYPTATPGMGETEYARILAGSTVDPFADLAQASIVDLGGGALRGVAAPQIWTGQGIGRATVVGGRQPDGTFSSRTWWH